VLSSWINTVLKGRRWEFALLVLFLLGLFLRGLHIWVNFDCDDVIMVIYFWILGGVWPWSWWRLMTGGRGGKKCQKNDDVICEWPLIKTQKWVEPRIKILRGHIRAGNFSFISTLFVLHQDYKTSPLTKAVNSTHFLVFVKISLLLLIILSPHALTWGQSTYSLTFSYLYWINQPI
jgi:hypothetical protein